MNNMEERKWLKKKEKALLENNYENLFYACKELADIYVNQEDYQHALSQYEQCEEAANRCGDEIRLAVANRMIGEMYCYLNDFENAIKHQKVHLKISYSKNDVVEQQRALATLGRTHFLHSETLINNEVNKKSKALKTSVKYYVKSLEVCNKLGKEVGTKTLFEMKARLYLNLSLCEESAGDLNKSMEYINKAMKLCSDADLNEELCKCYSVKSNLYSQQNNYSKAIACVDQGLQIASRLPNKKDIGTELLCLKAELLIDINDFQTAKQSMIKAYKLKVPIKNEFEEVIKKLKIIVVMCQAENNLLVASQIDYEQRRQLNEKLGDACVALKKYSKAIAYYEKMLENSENCGMSDKSLIPCYVSLAQTYKDNKQYYQASEYFYKELNLYSENSIEACKTLLNIADIMEVQYEPFDKIWSVYEKAKKIAMENDDGHLQLAAVKGMKCLAVDRDQSELVNELTSELNSLMKYETETIEDEYDVPDIWDDVSLKDLSDIDEEDDDKRRKRFKQTAIPEKKNEKGETPIIPACAKGNVKLVSSLLKQGHSVNAGDALGWTALHEASNYGYVDIVNVLLDHGADINNRGGPCCEGITPLHDAAACGHLEVIDCLLDRGANPLVRTNNGETPLDSLIACRNRVILEEKKELDPNRLAHFWSIVDRLSECLRKAGHTPPVPLTDVKEILKNEQQPKNHYLGIIPDNAKRSRKLYRSIEDSEKFEKKERNVELDDKNTSGAAEDYKQTISLLRNHKRHRESEIPYEISQPPLVENSVDEWLEDDIIYKPKKRYCTETKTNYSPIKEYNFENEDDSSVSEQLADFTSDIGSNKEIQCSILDSDEDSENICIPNREIDTSKHKYKSLMLSTSKKKNVQSKLEHQGFICMGNISPNFDDSSSVQTFTPLKRDENVKNINRTIKVRIENRLFLVPIPGSEENINLKWLSSEASRRYQKLEGVNPILNLTTDDGALLDENDPIDLVYGLQEVLGNIVGWTTETLIETYKKMCSESNTMINEQILQFLDVLEATGTLDMSDYIIMPNILNIALNVACHHKHLQVLCLSGVALEDIGMKMLSDHLSSLQQLTKLDVSCNNVSSIGIGYWATSLADKKSLNSLESFNISHNPLTNAGVAYLRLITQHLTSLRSLFLRDVDIDHNCYDDASELYLDNIEDLDLSFNMLTRTGISGFFIRLDPTRLKYLNVRNTGSSTVLRECVLFLERNQADSLHSVDFSGLDLEDEDIDLLCSCLESAGNLEHLWLADNPRVTQMCIDRIKHLSVKFVHMAGCKPVDISLIETIDLEQMSLSGYGQSNLFKNAPYNVKVSL
ncbi:Tetratricopeptide repeat,Tetratricopeptide repeat-containing domain,Tetratricopeptide-like helical [Cinara cedri]|uniref:Tetratricopeptide repeat,Tetratricopeptide repeat-containing domain,Tetratricopeptide-like helical n=1 Tax=Cinara cedri TaxID=506608 RepID=A0A5E4NA37_9HEMI|nr:Tetratricopeptide repeat,Tetratricopeptide repeat-containing domain,Tetratricopeptide-like helical [Cinara cedri]